MLQYETKEVLGPEDFMLRGMSCPRKQMLNGCCETSGVTERQRVAWSPGLGEGGREWAVPDSSVRAFHFCTVKTS